MRWPSRSEAPFHLFRCSNTLSFCRVGSLYTHHGVRGYGACSRQYQERLAGRGWGCFSGPGRPSTLPPREPTAPQLRCDDLQLNRSRRESKLGTRLGGRRQAGGAGGRTRIDCTDDRRVRLLSESAAGDAVGRAFARAVVPRALRPVFARSSMLGTAPAFASPVHGALLPDVLRLLLLVNVTEGF